MPSHILPKLLKLGDYELDKQNFTLKHLQQRKDSTGRKRRIEYACDECDEIYVTKLRDEIIKQFPFMCRSCRVTHEWKQEKYRISHEMSEETRNKHRQNGHHKFLLMWSDEQKKNDLIQKLRLRDPACYSKSRKSMRYAVDEIHWKSMQKITCVGSYELAFVQWASQNQIDFDWQIPHKMPDDRTYIVDAFIKTGEFANTWIEIKGWKTEFGMIKWEWFHSQHENSELWDQERLKILRIIK